MTKIEVDKARLLRRVIIISWITLGLCFVVKIFGGNFFEIMSDSPNYKALCEYADTHLWLKFIIGFLSSMLCQSFYVLAILQKYKFSVKELVITTVSVFASCLVKLYSFSFGWLTDIWLFILLPILFLGKNYKKYWNAPFALLLTLLFQFISLLVKNINTLNIGEDYFIGLIYSIDIYIMCVLYYLYRNYQKEQKDMGILWGLFMGKPVDKLKAMKAKREEKIAKLEKEIADIEIAIEQKKNEK